MVYPWDRLEIGDSFVIPDDGRVRGIHTNAKQKGLKVIVRKQLDGTYRVWRVK